MYPYRRLDPTRQTSSPRHYPHQSEWLTAISVPMPIPKTKQSIIVVRPEDSASQRQLLVDPELLSPPMGGSESWTYGEKTHTSSSEVSVTEQMLSELTKHVEETKAGGDNVSDIKPQRSQMWRPHLRRRSQPEWWKFTTACSRRGFEDYWQPSLNNFISV